MFLVDQRQTIFWTASLVVLGGIFAAGTMLETPREARVRRKPLPASVLVAQNNSDSRTPAAVNHDLEIKTTSLDEMTDHQAVELTLGCKGEKAANFVSGVMQVRLNGKACSSKDEIVSTEIRNEANGFSATVFFPDKKSFTTDYITLASGENKIRILHIFKKGTREEREFTINR